MRISGTVASTRNRLPGNYECEVTRLQNQAHTTRKCGDFRFVEARSLGRFPARRAAERWISFEACGKADRNLTSMRMSIRKSIHLPMNEVARPVADVLQLQHAERNGCHASGACELKDAGRTSGALPDNGFPCLESLTLGEVDSAGDAEPGNRSCKPAELPSELLCPIAQAEPVNERGRSGS